MTISTFANIKEIFLEDNKVNLFEWAASSVIIHAIYTCELISTSLKLRGTLHVMSNYCKLSLGAGEIIMNFSIP